MLIPAVGHAARARLPGSPRGVHLPAARASQKRQQVLGNGPDDLYVPDLRPPGTRPLRALQPGPAPRALRRRRHLGLLIRARIPCPPTFRAEFLPAGATPHCIDIILPAGKVKAESAALVFAENEPLGYVSDHIGLRARLFLLR